MRAGLVLLSFLAGTLVAVQPSINARLAQRVGVLESACLSFAVGTLALFALVLAARKGSLAAVAGAPWWELTGGFFGAAFVTISIVAVPRIGTGAALSAVIAGQLLASLLLDHLGVFGLARVPVAPARVAGALLLLAGAALIVRR